MKLELNSETTLIDLLKHMKEHENKTECSATFENALGLFSSRIARMQDTPSKYRGEIKEAKEFLDQNDIEGLDMVNVKDHVEMLELAL